jgi:hypothetical protein
MNAVLERIRATGYQSDTGVTAQAVQMTEAEYQAVPAIHPQWPG